VERFFSDRLFRTRQLYEIEFGKLLHPPTGSFYECKTDYKVGLVAHVLVLQAYAFDSSAPIGLLKHCIKVLQGEHNLLRNVLQLRYHLFALLVNKVVQGAWLLVLSAS